MIKVFFAKFDLATADQRRLDMKYGTIQGVYEIFVDGDQGEKELDVLRAIVLASFELAQPVPGVANAEVEDRLSNKEVDALIKIFAEPGRLVVFMDQVGGRWCATHIERVGKNNFRLGNVYQQYRGIPDPMFKRAQAILITETDSREFSSD